MFAVLRVPAPGIRQLASAPWWLWTGGLMGANYIVITILLAPRLGASTMLAFIMGGQILVSLLLDHFGLIGYPAHPVTVWRLGGAALLLAGMAMIQRF